MKGFELVKRVYRWDLYNEDGHKIASTLDGCLNKLSTKNCQAIERGYDLDELAEQSREKVSMLFKDELHPKSHTIGFRAGWQQAVNMIGAMPQENETEWDVEVEMQKHLEGYEMIGHQKGVYGSGNRIPIYNSKPKLDADGCLILKLKSE